MYDHIDRMIANLKDEASSNKDSLDQIDVQARDRITELESIRSDIEDSVGEFEEYIQTLEGRGDLRQKAARLLEDGHPQGIAL